jgi:anti-anti-sigma regulatory factor
MKITTSTRRDCRILKITDRIDVRTDLPLLRSAFSDCLAGGAKRAAVSFTRDTHLNSSLIAEMVIFLNLLHDRGGSLAIIHPHPHMRKRLEQFGIGGIAQIVAAEDEIDGEA